MNRKFKISRITLLLMCLCLVFLFSCGEENEKNEVREYRQGCRPPTPGGPFGPRWWCHGPEYRGTWLQTVDQLCSLTLLSVAYKRDLL